MEVREAIERRRSIRRFSPKPIDLDWLYELVQAARLAPQASNVQPMRYMIVHQEQLLGKMFACTRWAGYLENYAPPKGMRPTAYIVVLVDESLKKGMNDTDAGAAVENILLRATELGLGSCWIGSVNREKVAKLLGVPEGFRIHSLVALGHPAEEPVWEEKEGDSIRYYLDEEGRLHVPKRRMSEILLTIEPDLSAVEEEE